MSKLRLVVLGLLAVIATGCASSGVLPEQPSALEVGLADVEAFVDKDLDAAIARAAKATDPGAPFRARCYVTLKEFLPKPGDGTGVQLPVGLVDGFEAVAELDAKLQGGGPVLPPKVQADCAYIIARMRMFAIRNAAKFAPVPGAAGLAPLLK